MIVHKKPSFKEFIKQIDLKYYLCFTFGVIVLVLTIVLVVTLSGDYLEVITYPTIAYFILKQILGGFGFITGYIPIAQWIIRRLSKSAKKKEYSPEEEEKLDKKLQELEAKEEKEKAKFEEKKKELSEKKERLKEKIKIANWSENKIKKEQEKLEKEKKKLEAEKKAFEEGIEGEKKKIKERRGESRGRLEETIIKKQEADPRRFKLILIIPLYVMTAIGIFIALWAIVEAIIAVIGIPEPTNIVFRAFDAFDWALSHDIYTAILAAISILTFYMLPSIWLIKNPERPLGPKVYRGMKRKVSDWWKRKVTKDHRTIIERQFADLRRLYWEVKRIMGNILLIPIGIAQFVTAPVGGLAVGLGIKSGIQRRSYKKYEHIFMVIVSATLMALLVFMHVTDVASAINNITPIKIISKLIYGLSVIASFIVFTKMPIAEVKV